MCVWCGGGWKNIINPIMDLEISVSNTTQHNTHDIDIHIQVAVSSFKFEVHVTPQQQQHREILIGIIPLGKVTRSYKQTYSGISK